MEEIETEDGTEEIKDNLELIKGKWKKIIYTIIKDVKDFKEKKEDIMT